MLFIANIKLVNKKRSLFPGGVSVQEGLCPGGVSVQEGSLSRRGLCPRGVSVRGSMSRGCMSRVGLCLGDLCPGGSLSGRPPVWVRAGGTHPTGMHFCDVLKSEHHMKFILNVICDSTTCAFNSICE